VDAERGVGGDRHEELVGLRLALRVELRLRGDLRGREEQVARLVDLLAGDGDLDGRPGLPAHRHDRQQSWRGEADLLRERRTAEPECQEAGGEAGEGRFGHGVSG
jgi:hypothetical protein